MNIFFRYIFIISLNFFLFAAGWYLSWTDHINLFKYIFIFINIFLIFFLILFFIRKKQINLLIIIFIFFLNLGDKTYSFNYLGLNNFIYSSLIQIKYNSLGNKLFKLKEYLVVLLIPNAEKLKAITSIDNFEINNDFDKKILLNIDDKGNYLLQKNNSEYSLNKILSENEEDNYLTPIYADSKKIILIKNHASFENINSSLLKYEGFENQWKIESQKIGFHHWGDVFKNKIYVPGRDFIDLPSKISKSFDNTKYSKCNLKNSWNEFISIHNLDTGKLINKIYIMPILANAKNKSFNKYLFKCMNPIHFNDIQIIKIQNHANFFKNGKVGDILLSLRNIHTILLIDKDDYKIKWQVTGSFVQQHSPRILNKGTIIVFDNLGSNKKNGESRITEISIKKREIVGIYEAQNDEFFESVQRGRLQIYEDVIYVQNHEEGNLFKLVCEENTYISNECKRINIFTAKDMIFNFSEIID